MMTPERYQQIGRLYHAALELEAEHRAAFLDEACAGDAALRQKVEALLAAGEPTDDFIERPALEVAAGLMAERENMATVGPSIDPAPRQVHRVSSSDSPSGGRFVAGTMLAGRYRIIGLLGKGGMGEVYKAEDIKLNQTVALKFLPDALALDGAMLARFHNEVRTARRITHPNVCRVHDIGEVNGLHFISMEFIDGEDLSSLLRRIGRLPGDKAVELARQICAGLAAAHEQGVLHRDLKPANVMIDGRGKARITDFGLAVVSAELSGAEVIAGTPAYMSPEQLTGKEVTPRSDIYALGLVLYELFTGKRVFEAKTIGELIQLHEKSTPPTPSNHVKDIDPLAERVIMRCLEKDPQKRPASAVQVALALPGGDPLQAALAAGETPSPEMVAAAGGEVGLRPAVAVACLAAVVIGLVVAAWMNTKLHLIHRVPFSSPPEVLAHRAREIAAQLGYPNQPADSVWDFAYNTEYLRYVRRKDPSSTRWDHLQSQAILFRYRESPQYFQRFSDWFFGAYSTSVHLPPSLPGMINLGLDSQGRLLWFSSVPLLIDEAAATAHDWATLLRAAGLDVTRLTQVESKWTPPSACDIRTAWVGTSADQPTVPLRIEAAAWRGKPVYFEIVYPWTQRSRIELLRVNQSLPPIHTILYLVTPVIAALVAWSNRRRSTGDYHIASKLACLIFSLNVLSGILSIKYTPILGEIAYNLFGALLFPTFWAALVWLCYFAFEPYVRRRWPTTIISWNRIMTGRLRDALVGRDVLIGALGGIAFFLLSSMKYFHPGYLPMVERESPLLSLLGMRMAGVNFIAAFADSVVLAVALLFLFFFLRVLLRRQWLAAGMITLLITATSVSISNLLIVSIPIVVLYTAVQLILMLRFGLLALIFSLTANYMLKAFPITLSFSSWYAGTGMFALLAVLALAVWGFHTSLGGQKVFEGKLLEE